MKQVAQKSSLTQSIKKSKFTGICIPVSSIDESKEIILDIEKEYRKATHVCWAYTVANPDGQIVSYCSDAGEPHNSAGPPILAAIEGRKLVNTLCVVIRYFGGIKLGIGGLIRAYGGVAGSTLDRAGFVEISQYVQMKITVRLSDYPRVIRFLQRNRMTFQQEFDAENVTIAAKVEKDKKDRFISDLDSLGNIQYKLG